MIHSYSIAAEPPGPANCKRLSGTHQNNLSRRCLSEGSQDSRHMGAKSVWVG